MSEYAARKAKMYAYLGGCCTVCGSTERLNIDHTDASQKSFDIMSHWARSWSFLKPELDKCQLLCEQHHKEKTKENREHAGGRNRWSEIQHGKVHAYTTYGCRCDLCREAKRKDYLDRKARKQAMAQR